MGVRVQGERSAVGAGHARPARVRLTGACGKAARRGQDPSLQDDDNGCFVGSGLDPSAGCVRQTAACQKAAGRIYAAPTGEPQKGYGVGFWAGHARPLRYGDGEWDIIIGLRRRINVADVEFPSAFLLVMTNSFR